MFKVLLAQRDKKNNSIIRKALEKKVGELEFIEIQAREKEILEAIKMIAPDILVLSFELQESLAVDIMKRLKDSIELKPLHIIVTTKKKEHDDLRNVFRMGASDCLVEPLNADTIIDSVEVIMEKVLSNKIKNIHSIANERKMTDYNILAEYTFFYDVMFNEDSKRDLRGIKRVMDVGKSGFIVIFDMKYDEDYGYDYFQMQKKLKNKLFKNLKILIGPVLQNRMCVYVQCEEGVGDDTVKTRNRLHWTTKEIYDLIRQEGIDSLRAGVGRIYPVEKIGASYEEALRALAEHKNEEVAVYREKVSNEKVDMDEYKEKVEKLVGSIELGNGECFTLFEELLFYIEQMDEEERYNRVLLILILVITTVRNYVSYETEAKYYVEEFKKIFELQREDINIWATKRFNSLIKGGKHVGNIKYSEFVKFCMEYIYDNYREDIVLKDLALECNISVQYLSKMFREEVGMNFVDFLNRFRIKKAKELMIQNKMSIKEICFEVGYNDPNYFSRIFKKNTGKTPRKYISEHSI